MVLCNFANGLIMIVGDGFPVPKMQRIVEDADPYDVD